MYRTRTVSPNDEPIILHSIGADRTKKLTINKLRVNMGRLVNNHFNFRYISYGRVFHEITDELRKKANFVVFFIKPFYLITARILSTPVCRRVFQSCTRKINKHQCLISNVSVFRFCVVVTLFIFIIFSAVALLLFNHVLWIMNLQRQSNTAIDDKIFIYTTYIYI